MQIIIKGLASDKKYIFKINIDELELTLLDYLHLKDMPIASSCSGMGICKKCITTNGEYSCELKVKDCIGKIIAFGYL